MKILMFGRGAISVLYGWAFEKAGHTVEFYVRPGRMVQYGHSLNLEILDARKWPTGKQVNELWPVHLREELSPDHDYDLIIVSVQHYNFEEVAAYLAPLIGKATVLIFNNFWTEPLESASAFPLEQLAWGFPLAGGGFGTDGTMRGSLLGSPIFGTFMKDLTPREVIVRKLFKDAGFGISEQRDFRSWLFTHFALTSGILAEGLKAGSLATAINSQRHRHAMILNMREVIPLLEARSVDLKDQASLLVPLNLPTWILGSLMGLGPKLLPTVRLMLNSHSNTEELRSTCRDVLAEAHRLNIQLPRLEAASALF